MIPGVYFPLRQEPLSGFQVALRVRGETSAAVSAARAITTEMDAELPVYDIEIMTEELDQALWTRRATSWLIGAFSGVALLLAIAGIYGVISYTVGQRSKEISIRMAMGARKEDVLRQILRQGIVLVALGVGLGLVVSLAGARLVTASGLLVGVQATDPRVYLGVTLVILAVAGVANYLPARRAAGLDPMHVLRGD
jgi:ABC-type antimicrobial peptide transport system permease subunit